MIDCIDRAHVIAMPVLLLAPICEPDAEGCAADRCLYVMNAQGITAEQGLHETCANQLRQRNRPSGMDYDRTRDDDHFLSGFPSAADQGCRLLHGGLDLSFR